MTTRRPPPDKITALRALALALWLCGLGSGAQAVTLVHASDTTGGPTFQRPVEDLSALSAIGTAAHYDSFTFVATVTGLYTFFSAGAFDTFAVLYGPSFNPASSLANALIANDDLGNASFNSSGFAYALHAGDHYTHVLTGFDNDEAGAFTTTITAPLSPVPEPASWALMGLALAVVGCVVRQARSRRHWSAE